MILIIIITIMIITIIIIIIMTVIIIAMITRLFASRIRCTATFADHERFAGRVRYSYFIYCMQVVYVTATLFIFSRSCT